MRTLPEGLRESVARLLVATERHLDSEPERALLFAKEAKRTAARVSLVREAVGIAAYAQGDYSQALSELRAVRRMTGSDEHLAMMADCERALGRPQKALELIAQTDERALSAAAQIECRVVAAGARRDLEQWDAAELLLDIAALESESTAPEIGRLRYAYADLLVAMGRNAEARHWFERAAETDAELDAAERIADLDG